MRYSAVTLVSAEERYHPVAKGCDTVGTAGMNTEGPVRWGIYSKSHNSTYLNSAASLKVVLDFLELDDARVEFESVGLLLDFSTSDGELDVTVSVRG